MSICTGNWMTSGRKPIAINFLKTEEIRVNTIVNQGLRLNGEDIRRSSDLCYLGSIVAEIGGTSKEVNWRIQKAKGIILQIEKSVAK